ncbi:hypothetical protein BKI52_05670 [marine bacterium AO1-C]|nr:hypothetical protein BKI52_05670 [marine bacterium AO1-C]
MENLLSIEIKFLGSSVGLFFSLIKKIKMYEYYFFKKVFSIYLRFCFTFIMLVLGYSLGIAQDSTTTNPPDTSQIKPRIKIQDTVPVSTLLKKKKRVHSPRKALLYSAAFPGFGQIYNRKYWKLIVIYGVGTFIGLNMKTQHDRFLLFRDEFVRKSNDPDYVAIRGLDAEGLQSVKNQAKRDRDFMIILAVLVYGLQMVDANVDAHLMDFDLDNNLSLRLKPTIENGPYANFAGLSLSLRLK